MSETLPRFVAVVGCQRSGTTLLSQMIGAHPSALLVDETDDLYEEIALIFHARDERARNDLIGALCQRAAMKYRTIDALSPGRGTVVVLQAPNLTWGHVEIANRLPDARVVYMLRDVRGVVASMQHLPQIPFVENQIKFFRRAGFIEKEFPDLWAKLMDGSVSKPVKMALVARIKMSLAQNFESAGVPVRQVRYEDLVLRPKKTLSGVLHHVGLLFDEKCLSHGEILQGHGPGGTDRTRPVDAHSVSKWRTQLDPEMEEAIWAEVGEFYETLGYRRGEARPEADNVKS